MFFDKKTRSLLSVIGLCLKCVVQTDRVGLSWLTLSSLRAFAEAVFGRSFIAHDVWIRSSLIGEGWAWPYHENGHRGPVVRRALPTVRPRRSNSSAVIRSRSMIESLTRSFLAAAVFATAFGFFFGSETINPACCSLRQIVASETVS